MEGLPNRKQRREWAKQTGMLRKKSKAPLKEWSEMCLRSAETGKQIHLNNTEKMLRQEEDIKNKMKTKKIEELLMKGFSQEEALKIVNESD